MAAVATLQNLSDEPANLIQFTIVKVCIGTIIRIAREDVVKCEQTDLTSFMAKNTLVTLSHWFRKIATSGSERMMGNACNSISEINTNILQLHGSNGSMSPGVHSNMTPGGTRSKSILFHNPRLEPTVYNQWS